MTDTAVGAMRFGKYAKNRAVECPLCSMQACVLCNREYSYLGYKHAGLSCAEYRKGLKMLGTLDREVEAPHIRTQRENSENLSLS